jgi:hypothetical protein
MRSNHCAGFFTARDSHAQPSTLTRVTVDDARFIRRRPSYITADWRKRLSVGMTASFSRPLLSRRAARSREERYCLPARQILSGGRRDRMRWTYRKSFPTMALWRLCLMRSGDTRVGITIAYPTWPGAGQTPVSSRHSPEAARPRAPEVRPICCGENS